MALASISRSLLIAVLLLTATIAVAACSEEAPTPELISASLLIETPTSAQWFDLSIDKGTDGYELLEAATDGNIEAEWYPAFRSHFVQAIQGVAPQGSEFWSVFVWNETASDGAGAWEPLPIGADLFSVKGGHVMGWALVEYNPDAPQLPQSLPSAR